MSFPKGNRNVGYYSILSVILVHVLQYSTGTYHIPVEPSTSGCPSVTYIQQVPQFSANSYLFNWICACPRAPVNTSVCAGDSCRTQDSYLYWYSCTSTRMALGREHRTCTGTVTGIHNTAVPFHTAYWYRYWKSVVVLMQIL